jgi:hypothetical protein
MLLDFMLFPRLVFLSFGECVRKDERKLNREETRSATPHLETRYQVAVRYERAVRQSPWFKIKQVVT